MKKIKINFILFIICLLMMSMGFPYKSVDGQSDLNSEKKTYHYTGLVSCSTQTP